MRRRTAAIVACGCLLASMTMSTLTAWSSVGATRAAGAAGPLRLTVGTLGTIGSLDPRRGNSEVAREVWNFQYPTLTSLDPKTLDPAPGLAAAWSPAPRGRGWIYNLPPGLTWLDGQPVSADDVVYSFDHARDERWPYAATTGSSTILSGLTVRALNAHSVEVTSQTVDPLPGLLLHVVPAHVFSNTPSLDSNVAKLGVAYGTWHVVTKSADSVELDARGGPAGPALQQIVFRTYPNAGSLLDALAHKQVDVASGLPDSDVGKLEAMANVTVDHASDGTQYLLRDRVSDPRLRRAISLAIDRTELVTRAVDGVGAPGVVPVVARGASWALDDATVQSLTSALDAQPGEARKMIGRLPDIGRPLMVSIPPDRTGQRVGAFVRSALQAAGVATAARRAGAADSGNGPRPDLVVYRVAIGDDPFTALHALTCDGCPRDSKPPPGSFTTELATVRSMLHETAANATVVGLFEPDTLQAFRTENITGFLREPEQRSLVAFAPTVSQYSQLVAAPPPPEEQLGNGAYALGAVVVLALCGAAYAVAAWIRRRYVIAKETHEG